MTNPAGTLSPTQRLAYITYLNTKGYTDADIAAFIDWPDAKTLRTSYVKAQGGSDNTLATMDSLLKQAYDAVRAGGGFGKAPVKTEFQNPLPAIGEWFVNNLVRLGEIVVGVVIVAVGVNAVIRGSSK